jgi:osmotically-inducible protein OsmY
MKTTCLNTGKALKIFGLILTLSAIPLLVGVNGCATGNRYEQSAAERNKDQNTSSLVKYELSGDAQYKFDAVNVDTFKGTVQLSGFVTSRDQKSRAGELARRVTSVREVVNNLMVKESAN